MSADTWARASSLNSVGVSVCSVTHVEKVARNPCGVTPARPMWRLTNSSMALENWLEQHRYLNMDDLREHKKEALRRAA